MKSENDEKEPKRDGRRAFLEEVHGKSERKSRARREGDRGIWFGLGMFGLVGWSVMIPTLLGIAVGVWLDLRFETETSWTLTGVVVGVAAGALNAWFWVKRKSEER